MAKSTIEVQGLTKNFLNMGAVTPHGRWRKRPELDIQTQINRLGAAPLTDGGPEAWRAYRWQTPVTPQPARCLEKALTCQIQSAAKLAGGAMPPRRYVSLHAASPRVVEVRRTPPTGDRGAIRQRADQ